MAQNLLPMNNKPFNDKHVTKAELRAIMCKLAKKLGVNKVIFNKNSKRVRGTYNAFTNNVFIDLKQTKKDMLNTFFHELGHHKAVKTNRWKNYHLCLVKLIEIETMFLIENGVDRLGSKLWNKYVNSSHWGRYKYIYPKSQKTNLMKQMSSK